MDIKGKTIILTGAARIGQKTGEFLKNKGANLVVAYFDNPLESANLGVGVRADVSRKDGVEKIIEQAKKHFGKIDGLVHMAAIYERTERGKADESSWQKNIDVIAKSCFLFGDILGAEMTKNEGKVKGKIIFFSDWSVLARPYKDYLAYNAAKSAVVGLTKSFAKELSPHILVNAIAPGPILKPDGLTDKENKEVMAGTLLQRWGGAEEIAKGVCYLLGADFVTGQILTIDGGRTIA